MDLATNLKGRACLVAYSGGLDSHTLLHHLANTRPQIQLRAIHIHHGLNPQADDWVEHCQAVCKQLNVPLILEYATLKKTKQSLEARAREARYALFKKHLRKNEYLLTAHHQDDQAETLFLQLLRGAGLKGLSSMPQKIPFGSGFLVRPLLNVQRTTLEHYAKTHQLKWINDSSNEELEFDRNFLRHGIFPHLKKRWPSLTKTLSRTAKHLSEAQCLMDELASQDLKKVSSPQSTLIISELLKLSSHRQKNVIRYWLSQKKLPPPSQARLESIQQQVLTAKADAMPKVEWEGAEIRRYRNELYAMVPLLPHDPHYCVEWDLKKPLSLPSNLGLLTRTTLIEAGIDLRGIRNVTIKFRSEKQRCRIKGEKISRSLKYIFQSKGIPPWERDRIPLIYSGDQLIAILGVCVCESL